ncbi:MAG: DUF45 domain-containing protein [Erysipelotrichaceae bacterium]|nr:DUF45 domain-containing protein [Erysipelotrichaceae bacterium]
MQPRQLTVNGRHILLTRGYKRTTLKVKGSEILVNAADNVSEQEIIDFILSKESWLQKHLNDPRKHASFQWQVGAEAYVLGERYAVVLADGPSGVELRGDWLLISGPSDTARKKAFRNFCQQTLDQYLDHFHSLLNDEVGDYQLAYRFATGRWGSCFCNRRKIIMNLWCVALPPEGIRYVYCHELAHLKVDNHSRQFYERLGQLWPQYKTGMKITKTYII